jgi:hypothetical protein
MACAIALALLWRCAPTRCALAALRKPQLRTEYASVVGRVLAAHFRTYLSAMEKMAAPVAGQGDVLGVPPDIGGAGGAAAAFSGGVMAAMSGAMGLLGRGMGRATTVRLGRSGHVAGMLRWGCPGASG